ncbi:MAG: GGDEF domain-containing protein [Peptostreptococcaceae bacterium]
MDFKSILLSILLGITLILLIRAYIKIYKLRKETRNTRENEILKEILDASMEKRYMFNISEEINHIRNILMDYYWIDYSSIFLKEKDKFKCVSTNIEFNYIVSELEDYVKENVDLESKLAKIKISNRYMCSERKIKYRYLIPLSAKDGIIGALLIENRKSSDKKEFEIEFFELVVKNISVVLQNLIYQDTVTNMAVKDGLTGVWNRNYMNIKLNEFILNKSIFSIVILDIDDFKKVNDIYGHEFGDVVLKEVSSFIKDKLGAEGEIYRYGGEEFIISINNKTAFEVFDFIDNVRSELATYNISHNKQNISITSSFGIAEFPLDGESILEVINNADKALYLSKKTGKNKVTISNKVQD